MDPASGGEDDGTCAWARSSPSMRAYHDLEWGVPVRDDRSLFELLTLEGAQAGLSWSIVLAKRQGYRRAFAGFAPDLVARFADADVERLVGDPSIVRNRQKIESTVSNARVVDAMHRGGETLAELLWSFVTDVTLHHTYAELGELPSSTPVSKAMSAELRRRGMRFVGPVTCYSTMQAAGLVNDHVTSCPRWAALGGRVGSAS
ncbi:MAG TPA: DNA-3-methyladenine glycosylase I [Acidimicrobiales bacterium]|nr:DNA-3-methyladenine glycosylase I [Acidimicrobiales bacterium]HLN42540.1 DNA-3-methyladenine glycosylase I [Acidimicrobiales bacterium]